jgi:2,3-bisphosphoglycerate-independent phosphoglycerate mutase
MKYVVLVPDGCADEPVEALGGRTPLEAAAMPHLQSLASRSEVGRATVIPPGLPPGSDVGNLAILGYDPLEFHTGRAPIEAAAMGVELGPDEVAYRCNLVTIDASGTMVDFAAGHLSSEQSHPIVAALDAALGNGRDGVRFHAGVEYRHLAVVPRDWADAECVPPHDLTGKPAVWPTGSAAPRLMELMEASRPVVADAAAGVGSIATQIWLWGQGVRPTLPPFAERFGVEGRLTSAVDLVRGLGVLVGIEVLDVPGASAGFDNDYAAQRDACLASLADRDFFLLHVEATDEAGHQQDVDAKVDALESWDREIIGPLLEALPDLDDHRVLLMPDHATPLRLGTHTSDPVPYLLYDSVRPVEGRPYREDATAALAAVPAHGLMGRMTTGARAIA